MSYQQPYQQPPQPPGMQPPIACPYCGAATYTQVCNWCGRDTTAPRRPCPNCRRIVPTAEPLCFNCGTKFVNEMSWKIPIIILIFIIAIFLSILIRSVR